MILNLFLAILLDNFGKMGSIEEPGEEAEVRGVYIQLGSALFTVCYTNIFLIHTITHPHKSRQPSSACQSKQQPSFGR
jgi:hypothetical protein